MLQVNPSKRIDWNDLILFYHNNFRPEKGGQGYSSSANQQKSKIGAKAEIPSAQNEISILKDVQSPVNLNLAGSVPQYFKSAGKVQPS